MPRNRPKKGKKYSESQVKQAVEEAQKCIRDGTSFSKRGRARKYGISKDLLDRRLKGKGLNTAGRPPAIPAAEEKELAESLIIMSKWGFGLTKEETKDLIQTYVRENGISTPFTFDRPGDDWYLGFQKRFNLTIKKPEPLEKTRREITGDPFIIYDFYKKLKSEVTRLNLENKPDLMCTT